MIGVDGERLPAWRMLLHLPLQLERYSAIAVALNVIPRSSTPALCRCLDRCSKRRTRLGNEARLSECYVFIRTISLERFAAVFRLESDGPIRPRVNGGGIDHAV